MVWRRGPSVRFVCRVPRHHEPFAVDIPPHVSEPTVYEEPPPFVGGVHPRRADEDDEGVIIPCRHVIWLNRGVGATSAMPRFKNTLLVVVHSRIHMCPHQAVG